MTGLVAAEARSALHSLRRAWRPFVVIQGCAFALAIGYGLSPTLRSKLAGVAEFKAKGGLGFAVAATIGASLVLPEIAARLTRHAPVLASVRVAAFYAALFGLIGTLVYEQYELWARVIGSGTDAATVARKVLLDMAFFSPLLSMPMSTTALAWRDAGLRWEGVPREWRSGAWIARYVRTLLPCWAFWIPAVTAVYAMPTDLQFPLYLLMQGAWAILLVTLAPKEARRGEGI